MSVWRFYDELTGVMRPRIFNGSADSAQACATVGCKPIPGIFDHLSQRVDISAQPPPDPDPWPTDGMGNPLPREPWYPPVIDYQLPAPEDDTWQTWAWDANTKRWVSTPTLAAIKRSARQRMAAAWNQDRTAGVSIGGKVAPTDADAWTRYLAIKEMAADGGWIDVPIPLVDGTFELLTQAKLAALWTALKTMERELLVRLRDRVDSINAAADATAVDAVVW
jgi:hypothetical protein